ncbi:hypothetical protein [Pseudomonas purpurea]|uniref:hypothetical protein n=1 Tax=Pseudomonas purpurea TaxID=3136737 RepID=UPI0032657537
MSNQQIVVYIEELQLVAQKTNNYSLYLAKKVNDSFTAIWLAKGPVSVPGQSSYQYKNIFDISTISFMVNFASAPIKEGDITFTSGGKNLAIQTGQTTTLNQYGVFSPPKNNGTPGEIIIDNQLDADIHEILLDSTGQNIWANCTEPMSVGISTMTPKNQFQLWFGSFQGLGSLIRGNVSNPIIVDVNDDETKTITYNNSGNWVAGEPAIRLSDTEISELNARVKRAVMRAA